MESTPDLVRSREASNSIIIALCQPDLVWEDRPANLAMIRENVFRAAAEGADVAVFPEMADTGFSMSAAESGQEVGEGSWAAVSAVAASARCAVVAGLAARVDGVPMNLAVAVDSDGRAIAESAKLHLFSLAGEDDHFSPGTSPGVFQVCAVRSSMFVCYDLRFPEEFRRVAGVDIVYVLANWPATRQEHWRALLRARAIENQCYVVGVNRVGRDGNDIEYRGGSLVYDPMGETVVEATDKPEQLVARIDLDRLRTVRRALPFLKDMRPTPEKI